ncbi:MAG: DNA polymerase I [Candidatus Omnitrophica bacterium]|nr:DNA polymerase I [Candidatus Omnitrophota bacterium]
MSNQKVFLIDAHGVCYRAFYAVKALANSKGQPTNAVFGFCNILRKLMRDFQPVYMAACFDVSRRTLRQEKFAEYKAQRQAMPEDLKAQIPVIRDILRAYQIPIFELEGFEADDVMATLATRFSSKDMDVVIVSDDKDLSQLMGEHIHVFSPRQEKILTQRDVQEKFGIPSSLIVDYIALVGDSSDNIPGVAGVGPVSAVKLLTTYGSLERIYQNIEQIKPAGLQEKLRMGRAQAHLCQDLALVDTQVPLDVKLEDLKLLPPNENRLYEMYTQLEFRKFAQELSQPSSLLDLSAVNPIEQTLALGVDHLQVKEDGHIVNVVYDLKSIRKESHEATQKPVFDVFLAQYLLSGGLNRAEIVRPSSEKELEQLYKDLKQQIHEQQLDFLFYDVEMPLADVLYEMERNGVQLDINILKEFSIECAAKIVEVQDSLYKIAGVEFNVNSPKQLSEILFERLKLPVVKKTKTGFSTDEEVLHKLVSQHPLPALILEYRQLAKLKSTYIDALPLMVDSQSRVHASFNQTGTETGRLSSNNPNLQNIPIRTELGRKIRKAFVSYGKDHWLLSADYSQIELRLLAHCSRDENLMRAFQSDGDIHRYTASLMFDVSEDQVDDQMRYAAKRINFGIIYGMSAFGLAKDMEISNAQAQEFINKYFLRYPRVREMMDLSMAQAKDYGFVETLFHRRRYLPDINSANIGLRQFAQRQAINAPLQGAAADLIKLAMVKIDKTMKDRKLASTMIMTVHDELVFDVPLNEKEEMIALVQQGMETTMELSVPLKASLKIGPNWFDMSAIGGSASG